MIVADTNLIAYFSIHTENSALAEAVCAVDSVWAAPMLWRSEYRATLLKYLRYAGMSLTMSSGLPLKFIVARTARARSINFCASTGWLRTLDSSTAMASVFRLRPCVSARFFNARCASLDNPLMVIVIMAQP